MVTLRNPRLKTPIEDGVDYFSKTLVRTPVTKTVSNIDGDATYTESSAVNIKGAFFRRVDEVDPNKIGRYDGADAILLVKTTVTLNEHDKITYNSQNYRIEKVPVLRTLGIPEIYKRADCFLIE